MKQTNGSGNVSQRLLRLAVTDDHQLLRQGLISLLERFEDIEVLFEASDGNALIEHLRKEILLPDVILLDVNMPNMNGFETMEILKEQWPDIRVLVLSIYEDEYPVTKMINRGACGYLSKNCSAAELHEAIISVYTTGFYHSTLTPDILFESAQGNATPDLTAREKEAIVFCCSDLTNKEIADKMGISLSTFEKLKNGIQTKLNLKTRAGLVVFASKTGLVSACRQ